MLYKYRGVSNLQYALDILVNKRLHASPYKSLNDPMEGQYTYDAGTLEDWQIDQLFGRKNDYRLVSLSKTPTNMLMWAYYADSHAGFVVGVDVVDPRADIEPVRYVKDLGLERGHFDEAKRILTKKFRMWRHEQEHRVFVSRASFVKVEIRELIFGIGTNLELKALLTTVAKKFNPRITVRTISKEELDASRSSPA
ncbi:hypothetical protein [Rhodanobacter sp. Root627]|uniref:hypothetical protein n=1 Tax=Rhodanobacter sp. Root627 TaxID=1736572 RepID=UPI0009E9F56D|nr:hypothetical protein [Rhodanobacter sp. Root627]